MGYQSEVTCQDPVLNHSLRSVLLVGDNVLWKHLGAFCSPRCYPCVGIRVTPLDIAQHMEQTGFLWTLKKMTRCKQPYFVVLALNYGSVFSVLQLLLKFCTACSPSHPCHGNPHTLQPNCTIHRWNSSNISTCVGTRRMQNKAKNVLFVKFMLLTNNQQWKISSSCTF